MDADTDLLVNLTNDGWFGQSAAQWQHLASAGSAPWRTGPPPLLQQRHHLLVRCEWSDAGNLSRCERQRVWRRLCKLGNPLRLRQGAQRGTFYNRNGDWFGWTCVGVTVVLLLWRYKPVSPK